MALSLQNFTAWQKECAKLEDVRTWLAHIGATGRSTRDHTDILRISPAHCANPNFTLAGQYYEGGPNYWPSPVPFNEAMGRVILRRFAELSAEAIIDLERQTAEYLVKAGAEIEAVQVEIADAKSLSARVAD